MWVNGEYLVNSELVSADGWLKGEGIFETLLVKDGVPLFLDRHMRRALKASRLCGFDIPSEDVITEAVFNACKELGSLSRMRLLFNGIDFAIVTDEYLPSTRAARLTVVEGAEGIEVKRYPYDNRLQILEKVRSDGFDEALCINNDGDIAEGAVSSLIFKIGREWVTTPLAATILPGVMRALFIEKLDIFVRQIAQGEIPAIESAFLLSSLKIAQPVQSIDGRELEIDEAMLGQLTQIGLGDSVG